MHSKTFYNGHRIAENENVALETMTEEGREGLYTDDTIRTMEKKAINFIVNEYLLQINNKLTAVTFSEENEDQVIIIFILPAKFCLIGNKFY